MSRKCFQLNIKKKKNVNAWYQSPLSFIGYILGTKNQKKLTILKLTFFIKKTMASHFTIEYR